MQINLFNKIILKMGSMNMILNNSKLMNNNNTINNMNNINNPLLNKNMQILSQINPQFLHNLQNINNNNENINYNYTNQNNKI